MYNACMVVWKPFIEALVCVVITTSHMSRKWRALALLKGGSLLLVDVHVHIHAQAYSLMLRLSTPVYQGRDVICLV